MATSDPGGTPNGAEVPAGSHGTQEPQFLLRFLDLKFVLALLFLIFGTLVTIAGLIVGPEDLAKSAGININLWTGLTLLGLSATFGIWWFTTPPEVPTSTLDEQELAEGAETEIFGMP